MPDFALDESESDNDTPPTSTSGEHNALGSSESLAQAEASVSVTGLGTSAGVDGSTYTTGQAEETLTTSTVDTTANAVETEDTTTEDSGSESGCWKQHPLPGHDRALDFDVGVDGDIWVITDTVAPFPYPDFRILWRAGQDSVPWFDIAGGALKAAAGAGTTGWVTASTRLSFRWTEPSWELLEGNTFDLAIGIGGHAWAIGTRPCEGGYCVHEFSEALQRPGWLETALPERGGISIAVDHLGLPWIVDKQGQLWRWRETGWQEVGPEGFVIGIAVGGVERERAWILRSADDGEREFGELWSWATSDDVDAEPNWLHLSEPEAEGKTVAVDAAGEPWLLRRDGSIWQRVVDPSDSGECVLLD